MMNFIETQLLKLSFSFIYCNVCGNTVKIKIKTNNFREDCICKKCNSNSRKRHLASVFLKILKEKFNSYSSLNKIEDKLNINLYNVESNGALHNNLKHLKNYVCSEYFGDYKLYGKKVNGILNIDLMKIPFDSDRFHFIISSEVFEHIPNPYKAFNEIYRILKIGGKHIFTVPYYPNRDKDEIRSIINEKGEIVHLMEPQYHGDPIRNEEGILVYTIFSKEMLGKLENIGFKVDVDVKRSLKNGILGNNNIVFVTTKIS